MSKKLKQRKNCVQKTTIFLVIITIISIFLWITLYVINYAIGEEEQVVDENGNVKTGKIGMMSIPRDTSIVSNPTQDSSLKINYVYYNKGASALVKQVENMLNVNIDYYLIFDATMLREMVDTIGGVEIDVPIRMKYDDGSQNLHIDLKPGVQTLNGEQAEEFVRFRHNNDMTVGYPMGDVQRTQVQQDFIKAFINQALSAKNISKAPDLINIALKNTDTNITLREATKYISDISTIDINGIYSCTASGTLKDVGDKSTSWMSFYILDKEESQNVIKTKFPNVNLENDVQN